MSYLRFLTAVFFSKLSDFLHYEYAIKVILLHNLIQRYFFVVYETI